MAGFYRKVGERSVNDIGQVCILVPTMPDNETHCGECLARPLPSGQTFTYSDLCVHTSCTGSRQEGYPQGLVWLSPEDAKVRIVELRMTS